MIAVAEYKPAPFVPFIRHGDFAPVVAPVDGEFFAAIDALNEWAKGARAGAYFTYAKAYRLPMHCPIRDAARALYDDGLITLVQQPFRHSHSHYLAKRTPKRWPMPMGAAQAAALEALASPDALRLLALFAEVAAKGALCPPDHEVRLITKLLPYRINQARTELIVLGLIDVRNFRNSMGGSARVITICGDPPISTKAPDPTRWRVVV
jgi:hypothetical protein